MPRRMVDTEIWKKDWFLDLSFKQKCLVKFLYDNCDCAGIYEISYRMLRSCFNEEIKKEDFEGLKQIRFISENKIFIEDFIKFQYGISINELNPSKSNVHKGIYKSLEKNGLLTLNEPLSKGSATVLDKDKVKDKELDTSFSSCSTSSFSETKTETDKIDIYADTIINNVFEIYKTHCSNLIPLDRFYKRNIDLKKLIGSYLEQTESDLEYFTRVCDIANRIKKIGSVNVDLKMVLKNHDGFFNGKYDSENELNNESPYTYIGR